jgi:SAM-dependent methyltransferase
MREANYRYQSNDYLLQNPTWDEEDSPWKAAKILKLIKRHHLAPRSICEVGCGAGGVLAALRNDLELDCQFIGFDIAPALNAFWSKHDKAITFHLGDFLTFEPRSVYEVLLLIDVIEHLENPFDFLRQASSRAKWFILHIPLDLHVSAAFRNSPLLKARNQFGHLHYWNKDLSLQMLKECGLTIIDWEYTRGTIELQQKSLQRDVANIVRRLLFPIAPDVAVRILGGFSLLVLAKS